MVLIRSIAEAKYGHFAELLRGYEELNDIARARGWKPARCMMQAGGQGNILTADIEFDSLQQWEDEQGAAYSDAEFMKVLRRCSEYVVQGSVREEIWVEAPHLA